MKKPAEIRGHGGEHGTIRDVVRRSMGTAHVPGEAPALGGRPEERKPQMNTYTHDTADQATAIVGKSEIVELVQKWMREDGLAPTASEVLRPVLVAWLESALAGRQLTERRVAKTVNKMQESTVTAEDVLALTRQLLDLIDYSPLPESKGRLTKAEYEAVLADRRDHSDVLERKRRRFLEFTNALLRGQRDLIPELASRTYDVAISSVVAAADVIRQGRGAYNGLPVTGLVSPEPDAAYTALDPDKNETTYICGWEYEVATLAQDLTALPNIAVAIVGHSSREFAGAAAEMVDVLAGTRASGKQHYALDHVVVGQGYVKLAHSPLDQLKAKLVMPYAAVDEGRVMAVADGAVMVEGRWYRDDLPDRLRDAMKTYRAVTDTNREGPRVFDWDIEWSAGERRDGLVEARRKFETEPRDARGASKYVQHYAYGSLEWLQLTTRGKNSANTFATSFKGWHRAGETALTGVAAHGFLTTLRVVRTNAARINVWREHHALDEGNGLIVDEYSALFRKVESRIKESMAQWSWTAQPKAVLQAEVDLGWGAHWNIDHDDDMLNWEPNDATFVVNVTRADDETADVIADTLVARVRDMADRHISLAGGPYYYDVSTVMRIEMRFDFLDHYTMDEDNQPLPMPKEGLPLSAEVVLVPNHLPLCASPNRGRD